VKYKYPEKNSKNGNQIAVKSWIVGKKEKHTIEVEYPTLWGFTVTVKVDGKEFLQKSSLDGHPNFSFTLGKREKLNVEIKWSSYWSEIAEPICYVNGMIQPAQASERPSASALLIMSAITGIILAMIIILLVMAIFVRY